MFDYDPKYDMPPKLSRFFDRHPKLLTLLIFLVIVGALALVGAIDNA